MATIAAESTKCFHISGDSELSICRPVYGDGVCANVVNVAAMENQNKGLVVDVGHTIATAVPIDFGLAIPFDAPSRVHKTRLQPSITSAFNRAARQRSQVVRVPRQLQSIRFSRRKNSFASLENIFTYRPGRCPSTPRRQSAQRIEAIKIRYAKNSGQS